MSPDEWIHRGLEFAWKAWECRSEDQGGGGTGGKKQDIADELKWLDLAIECFSKAGSSGDKYVSKAQLNSRCTRFLKELQKPTAASIQQTEKDSIMLVAACIKEGICGLRHTTLRRCCHARLLQNLTTDCIFGGNGSSLGLRLEVLGWEHRQNPLPRQNKSKINKHTSLAVCLCLALSV